MATIMQIFRQNNFSHVSHCTLLGLDNPSQSSFILGKVKLFFHVNAVDGGNRKLFLSFNAEKCLGRKIRIASPHYFSPFVSDDTRVCRSYSVLNWLLCIFKVTQMSTVKSTLKCLEPKWNISIFYIGRWNHYKLLHYWIVWQWWYVSLCRQLCDYMVLC